MPWIEKLVLWRFLLGDFLGLNYSGTFLKKVLHHEGVQHSGVSAGVGFNDHQATRIGIWSNESHFGP